MLPLLRASNKQAARCPTLNPSPAMPICSHTGRVQFSPPEVRPNATHASAASSISALLEVEVLVEAGVPPASATPAASSLLVDLLTRVVPGAAGKGGGRAGHARVWGWWWVGMGWVRGGWEEGKGVRVLRDMLEAAIGGRWLIGVHRQ